MTTTANEPSCEFCDKRGLHVVVTRYAIAPKRAAAPVADAARAGDAGDQTLAPAGDTTYTQRVLRPGYVYAFDEARSRWEGHYVTPGGYTMRFEVGQPVPVAYTKPGIEPCSRTGHREVAGCITIRDPKRATKVWFAFSDVEWTAAVLKHHQDATYRARHMQVLDVAAWLATHKAAHAQPISRLGQTVAEYSVSTQPKAFAFSPSPWQDRRTAAQSTMDTLEKLNPGNSLVFALHDPAGLLQDLAALMSARMQGFVDDTQADQLRARKLGVSTAITQLQQAVRQQAETDEIAAAEQLQAQTMGNAGAALLFKSVREQVDEVGKLSAADLDRAADQAWARYAGKYDEPQRQQWQADYDRQLDTCVQQQIEPLGHLHAAWFKSRRMAETVTCSYDPQDARTGAAYTACIHACVRGTAGLKPCFELYTRWLAAPDAKATTNLVLRALVFNHDGVADAAKTATEIDKRIVPWDNVYGPYKTVVELVGKDQADEAAKLLHELTGPAAKVLAGMLDGPAKVLIGLMSLHAGKPWVRLSVTGSRKEFRKLLLQEVLRLNGGPASERTLRAAVDREIKRLQIRGERLEGRRGAQWVVLLDSQQLRGLPAGTPGQQAAWLQGKVSTVEQLQAVRYGHWKSVINTEARMGVISGILQLVCFTKLLEDERNSMAADKTESRSRLAAGALAIAGSVCEVSAAVVGKLPGFASAAARGASSWRVAHALLGVAGKALGVIGGVIMAGWDFAKGVDAAVKGQIGTAALYFGSALLGAVVTIGFLLLWNPVLMIVLVAAFVLVAWFLEKLKDNKLQSWLEQCIFGKGTHYPDAKLEMDEFELALK